MAQPEIFVDRRSGSKDYVPLLAAAGVKVDVCELASADFAFTGRGPNDTVISVGFEHKKLSDVVQSMRDGRFDADQLPGLSKSYAPVYLLIEGQWTVDGNGVILEWSAKQGRWRQFKLGQQPILYAELERWLTTLEIKTPIRVKRALDPAETVAILTNAWHWWNDKPFEKHLSYLGLHKTTPGQAFMRPTLIRRIAAELPGIGDDRSLHVARHFDSVVDMVNAPVVRWCIPKVIGTKMAQTIWEALRRRH